MTTVSGFPPFINADSELLILGSFPSVKSREINFYYGNPRNAFWGMLARFFGEDIPASVEDKKQFLTRRKIALWDVVCECEIIGSRDETIKNTIVADVEKLLQNSSVGFIILNGGTAYDLFVKHNAGIKIPYIKLPSTSPRNPRYSEKEWHNVLSRVFKRTV